MKNNLLIIAKEGTLYILWSIFLLVFAFLFDLEFFSFVFVVSTLLFLYIFRNPERQFQYFDAGSVVSPSDAKVTAIHEIDSSEYTLQVELQTAYSDVSLLRTPFAGQVKSITHYNGTRVSSKSKLFKDMNEFTEIVLCDENANTIKIVHRLEESFKGLDIDLFTNQTLVQTNRYGFMLKGRTTIYFPKNFRLSTALGTNLKAGESLMGYFS